MIDRKWPPGSRNRADIDYAYKWNLADIFPDWDAWDAARAELDRRIDEYAALKGTLGAGRRRLLAAYPAERRAGAARLQRLLLPVAAVRRGPARQHGQRPQAAGADPVGALAAGDVVVQPGAARRFRSRRSAAGWTPMPDLAVYRFAIEEVYRQQEHVLDETGRAAAVAVGAPVGRAARRLRRAVDRRREVPDSHAAAPARR